jgi:hypothetical protein
MVRTSEGSGELIIAGDCGAEVGEAPSSFVAGGESFSPGVAISNSFSNTIAFYVD